MSLIGNSCKKKLNVKSVGSLEKCCSITPSGN